VGGVASRRRQPCRMRRGRPCLLLLLLVLARAGGGEVARGHRGAGQEAGGRHATAEELECGHEEMA
jgi:hypothetical protein